MYLGTVRRILRRLLVACATTQQLQVFIRPAGRRAAVGFERCVADQGFQCRQGARFHILCLDEVKPGKMLEDRKTYVVAARYAAGARINHTQLHREDFCYRDRTCGHEEAVGCRPRGDWFWARRVRERELERVLQLRVFADFVREVVKPHAVKGCTPGSRHVFRHAFKITSFFHLVKVSADLTLDLDLGVLH